MNLINPNEDDAFEALGEMIEQAGSTRGSPLIGNAMNNDSTTRQDFQKWLLDTHGLESKWNPDRNCFEDYAAHLAYQAWREAALPNDYIGIPESAWHEQVAYEAECIRLTEEIDQYRKDAERYRWLRSRHWNDSDLCVVLNPKRSVKLGYICPSEERLDFAIDAAIEAGKK